MMKTVVYEGENPNPLGEVEIFLSPQNNLNMDVLLKKGMMRISHYSQPSERCPPLAVLHSITSNSNGLCFKMIESVSGFQQQHSPLPLLALHSTCLRENKTAVVLFGEQEIHLVAMSSRRMDSRIPCFWGFCVASGLYDSCLGMLNLRCLGIVFDLDETLIVANTLRSFEDRIEALQRKISVETDPQRLAGMMAEVKRYQDDKAILKQYAETDQVVDSGKVHKIQAEVVPAMSDNHQTIVRPLIRLLDKNIVLTRINPQIRDTSVLVRLRPAWEDLRSYLTARGRKRFEVYVCTMAERDYALEMWRLLDPDSNLISMGELLDRVVCVKSGLKKSLFNVFHKGSCHPRMALVIDDRLKVWDEKDQPRVHVVPAFAPYYAPQAEANNPIPVLCMARNVACNVRGGFFKDFDEGLLQQILEVSYEDDLKGIPFPDVSNYLVSEDDESSNKNPLFFDGMADAEVERRLKEAVSASSAALSLPSAPPSATINHDSRPASCLPFMVGTPPITVPQPGPQATVTPFYNNLFPQASSFVRPLGNLGPQDLVVHSSPAREEGEVPESELDPDFRRRLLILQHGQDTREKLPNESSFPVRSPVQAPVTGTPPAPVPGPAPSPVPIPGPVPGPVPRVQPRGKWFPGEGHLSPGTLSRTIGKEYPTASDAMHFEKQRPPPHPYLRKVENFVRSERPSIAKPRQQREAPRKDDRSRSSNSLPNHQSFQGDDISMVRSASSNRYFEVQLGRGAPLSESPVGALHDIAMQCGTKVEYKAALVATTELKFSVETCFAGEKIGEASGLTRREAQHRAAESSLMNLADQYLAHVKSDSSSPQSDTSRGHSPNDIGFSSDANSHGDHASIKDEMVPSSERIGRDDSNVDGSMRSMSSVSALKELCMRKGFDIYFRVVPSASTSPDQKDEQYAEVEIGGQVLGKGSGLTWDEAKIQAAERALANVKSMLRQLTQKRPSSPRSFQGIPGKRLKSDYPRGFQLQRMPSSRYPQNMSHVP